MNIQLNLLPETQKKILQRRKFFRRAIEQQLYVLFIIIFLLGGLAGIHIILASEVKILEGVVASQQQDKFRNQIIKAYTLFSQTNADMRNLYIINKSHITWTPILRLVSSVVGDRIRIDKIEIDNTQMTIIGVAQTRVDAVAFKKSLTEVARDGQTCFTDVTIPAEDLVAANLTTFKLLATIRQQCIMLDEESDVLSGEQPEQPEQSEQSEQPEQQEVGESPVEDLEEIVDANVDNS